MALLSRLWKEGRTIVMVSHDDRIAAYSQRTIHLFDGMLAD
jgi:ABC-type lipoprotein export system ATPase subunit